MKHAKRKVWFEPIPGVGLRAVVLKRRWFWGNKIIFRDINGECYTTWVYDGAIFDR